MGKNHQEAITELLDTWLRISYQGIEALSKGNIEEVTDLIDQTNQIQEKLDTFKELSKTLSENKNLSKTIIEISKVQTLLAQGLEKSSVEIKKELLKIKKNTTAMKGYKKGKNTSVRYISKHT